MTATSVSTAEKKNILGAEYTSKNHKKIIMLEKTLTRLKQADNLLNDTDMIMNAEKYYLNRIRDISSDLELLIEEIETNV